MLSFYKIEVIWLAIGILIGLSVYSCTGGSNKADASVNDYDPTSCLATPQEVENTVKYQSDTSRVSTTPQDIMWEQPAHTFTSVSLSPYDEGYEEGYDAGKYDAVSGNAEYDTYDDSSNYRGAARSQYIRGYREGYDEGYDDWYDDYCDYRDDYEDDY